MKIIVLGHSCIHVRQQRYWRAVAELGHDVLVICPQRWDRQFGRPEDVEINSPVFEYKTGWPVEGAPQKGHFRVEPLPTMGDFDQYAYVYLKLGETLQAFKPDWVYVNQESESAVADQVLKLSTVLPTYCARSLFTWENRAWAQRPEANLVCPPQVKALIQAYDLIVCGNGEAQAIMQGLGAKRTHVGLQVGLDTDHFQARPDVPRNTNVAYVGRESPDKGLLELQEAWPAARLVPWTDWLALPWQYSLCRVVVSFSQDRPYWREQAPNYVTCEAMACGAAVVTSDAGSIPFWLEHYAGSCPGAYVVPQRRTDLLKQAIGKLVEDEPLRAKMAAEGRAWVEQHLSTRVQAKLLLEAFGAA